MDNWLVKDTYNHEVVVCDAHAIRQGYVLPIGKTDQPCKQCYWDNARKEALAAKRAAKGN